MGKRGKSGICLAGEHMVSLGKVFNTRLNSFRLRDEELGSRKPIGRVRIEQERIF